MAGTVAATVADFLRDISEQGPRRPEYDGLRVFQHQPRLAKWFRGDDSAIFPVTIDLWPSLTCNARCPICPYRLSKARDHVDKTGELVVLPLELGGQLLHDAARCSVESVIFTGGGDPLLHPSIAALAQTARRAGLQWALFTNGILLDTGTATGLLNEKPVFLRVSLDAGNPESHSRIYGVPTHIYEQVISNVIRAACVARRLGHTGFGLSFTLSPDVSDSELFEIQRLIVRINDASNGGLGLVAFRPRIIHFHGRIPVCPQPDADGFPDLAERIERIVISQLSANSAQLPKVDLKKGLFVLASRRVVPRECLSSSWMTTVTQDGTGYVTAELAGDPGAGQTWGTVSVDTPFRSLWLGDKRKQIMQAMESGVVGVPVVHRTSPIDEVLKALRSMVGSLTEPGEVENIFRLADKRHWYRTRNPAFV